MMIHLLYGTIILLNTVSSEISCRNSEGVPVDWFIGYKLPVSSNDAPSESGLQMLYLDARRSKWKTAENINSSQSAVASTLQQLYSSLDDATKFYMLYNDDHPGEGNANSYRGHAKGVMVFDNDTGFWLIHSIPNFPPKQKYAYPQSGVKNGQSLLCITMKSSSLIALAHQMLYIQPSIYLSQLPTAFISRYGDLAKVIDNKSLGRSAKTFYSVEQLTSKSGTHFTSFAKHKKFNKDLYADLVAPEMKTSLFTETWMNGPNDFDSECSSKYTVNNIESLNVDGNQFKNSKDHSKWAISVDEKEPLLCIGDINRQKSQMKRGGGTVCILNDRLWGLYNKTIVNVQPCQIN